MAELWALNPDAPLLYLARHDGALAPLFDGDEVASRVNRPDTLHGGGHHRSGVRFFTLTVEQAIDWTAFGV